LPAGSVNERAVHQYDVLNGRSHVLTPRRGRRG
jgi:hypothetical protein